MIIGSSERSDAVPIELKVLGWCIALGLVYVFVAAGFATSQRGLRWNAGNRDGESTPLVGAAGRAVRANLNFLETFAFFAASVLAVVAANKMTPNTALGCEIYFWARVAYLPVYIIGIPYLRTLVYAVSIWGLLKVLEALF
jgi:uncharacterized MAPEG superfamily protein